jgi:hypothetical protein
MRVPRPRLGALLNRKLRATANTRKPPVRAWQIGKSGGRKQPVRGFIQMLLDAARIRQMTDEVPVQLVKFDTAQNVKLLAPKAKHLVTRDYRDMDAFTIQYVAIHDRPPKREPPAKAALIGRR